MARKNATGKQRRTAKASPPRRPSRLVRLIRWPLKWLFRAVLAVLVLALIWVAAYRFINPPGGLYMASESWRLGGISRDWQGIGDIDPDLPLAVMAAEDANFCAHNGFDFDAIRDALEARAEGRSLRGGSTLSQQVAKNVFLWHDRSWLRKGLEAGFTVLIELTWPKRRIVEVYLNMAEFGEGVFGAEAAARHYFDRSAADLTLTQAARLAAILPNPKERSASRPGNWTARRARSIAGGAETLRVSGRATCIE